MLCCGQFVCSEASCGMFIFQILDIPTERKPQCRQKVLSRLGFLFHPTTFSQLHTNNVRWAERMLGRTWKDEAVACFEGLRKLTKSRIDSGISRMKSRSVNHLTEKYV